jgi:hypothetical protein
VGTDNCVAVAEGGNQTIISVGVTVCVGGGVAVGAPRSSGRQAPDARSPMSKKKMRDSFIKE